MSRSSEFEEKEYEVPLYLELVAGSGNIWSPGQVLENKLGIDCALEAADLYWKFVGRRRKRSVGLQALVPVLRGMGMAASTGSLPSSFGVNLMLQVKRCTHYANRPHGCDPAPRGLCWRTFSLNASQQARLELLSKNLSGGSVTADVTYAAPSFHSRSDLWRHTATGRLIVNSTFPLASTLRGHTRWAYLRPGNQGFGLSEPEYIDGVAIEERLAEANQANNEPDPNRAGLLNQLRRLDQVVLASLGEVQTQEAQIDLDRFDRASMLSARIAAKLALHGIAWFVIGPRHEGVS